MNGGYFGGVAEIHLDTEIITHLSIICKGNFDNFFVYFLVIMPETVLPAPVGGVP